MSKKYFEKKEAAMSIACNKQKTIKKRHNKTVQPTMQSIYYWPQNYFIISSFYFILWVLFFTYQRSVEDNMKWWVVWTERIWYNFSMCSLLAYTIGFIISCIKERKDTWWFEWCFCLSFIILLSAVTSLILNQIV